MALVRCRLGWHKWWYSYRLTPGGSVVTGDCLCCGKHKEAVLDDVETMEMVS